MDKVNGKLTVYTETLKLLSKVFDVSINTLLGSPRKLVCQCCGMPLEDDDIIGHNHDGSFNEDYCKWCYADGTYTYNDMDDLIEVCVKNINITLKKTFGLWIYKEEKKENIRCLCSKCLKDYIHNPDYIVRRLDPFAKVKDHCDKCNQSGWDYVIAERQHNARGKGCQNV